VTPRTRRELPDGCRRPLQHRSGLGVLEAKDVVEQERRALRW
jgi:hypothetical protein